MEKSNNKIQINLRKHIHKKLKVIMEENGFDDEEKIIDNIINNIYEMNYKTKYEDILDQELTSEQLCEKYGGRKIEREDRGICCGFINGDRTVLIDIERRDLFKEQAKKMNLI